MSWMKQMNEDVTAEMAPVDMEFNVTIPMDLGEKCANAGHCVSFCNLEGV